MVITKDSESFDPGSSPGRTFLFCNFWSNAESRVRVGGCSGCALPVLVAQLDKASDYESEDWGFKSLQGYLLLFLNIFFPRSTVTFTTSRAWLAIRRYSSVGRASD